MSLKENFEAILTEKKLPSNYREIENGHHLYRFQFRVTKTTALVVEVIIQNTDKPSSDAQIIFRNIHSVMDYNKRGEALELINELNEMKTGYYSLFLAGDGEIFLRSLLRMTEDATPLYETIVFGSGISRNLKVELDKVLGTRPE
ncbi:hypothetical protein [Fundicoccus culcitae]|uniref:DUF669 domain-containing protein n=1 Tax=Fundicoccus culcitae TaxID=2969821 RepID=A0ABY5P6S6_9LACT|nr:hypothetical protein [Fundicoccus culcitae]UUX34108.1 hypothetical protein NRE15_00105 [Fundicoccus culcitae]